VKKLLRLPFVPIAFLCVFAVRLLSRFGILIRFGEFFSNRMGHLAGNTECYLCEKTAGISEGFDIWAHSKEPANKYLAKMIARKIRVDPTGFTRLIMLCNSVLDGHLKYRADSTQMDRDIYNLFEKQKPHLSFTIEEEKRGEDGLRKLGIPLGAKWVYLVVRDAANTRPAWRLRGLELSLISLQELRADPHSYLTVQGVVVVLANRLGKF